ncbi:MBL fold metallo-hydrolase [bacterium]|nr:MAG: MBL fold metallo-hydrolase [bacterium]
MEENKQGRFRVTLLGTGAPPPVLDRFGPSTLVEVGGERFLFDAGRGALQRLYQLKIRFADVLFLTHLHSDHVVGIPDLWLTGWVSGRAGPLRVCGPAGTRDMMSHLEKAFEFDIRVRRGLHPSEGVAVLAEDFTEGVVYDRNGIKVTAFEVDHGLVKPAFGFRIDYAGRSVILSGDTTFNENLIRHSRGADLVIHEVIAPDLFRAFRAASSQERVNKVIQNHATPEQAGEVLTRAAPKLAVYSHIVPPTAAAQDLIPATRKTYSGPLEVGEDLMAIEVGERIQVHRFKD